MIYGILFFIFGLIIGSFLNVVICRYNTGATIGGRSMCLSCGSGLTWRNLIPVFSYVFQRGHCSYCRSHISWQYPLVELLVASLYVGVFVVFGLSFMAMYLLLQIAILVVIAVYDIKHKIIPNEFVYAFSALSLGALVLEGAIGSFSGLLWHFLAGPLLAAPFAGLWYFSKGQWMGFGDAKLALGIGWFLGLAGGYVAIALSFWIGAVVSVGLIALSHMHTLLFAKKRVTMKSEIPFGPFLIAGTVIELFFATSLDSLVLLFV